jgi:hypothetical protein
MEQQTTSHASSSSPIWERLEAFVREQVRRFIQALLEEEITALLGRPKFARRGAVDSPRQDIRYSCGELTRPWLGNIRSTSRQSHIVHRSGPSKRESQHVSIRWVTLVQHGRLRSALT